PHLDTREMESEEIHSGNPFRWLIENGLLKGKHLVQFGARPNRNTRSSWEFCTREKVEILPLENVRAQSAPVPALFARQLNRLAKSLDQIGVTIDMDSCSDAEGTSAAPVLGFSAWELCCFAA